MYLFLFPFHGSLLNFLPDLNKNLIKTENNL